MPPSEPLRIFISYARKDGAALAQRLRSDLAKQGFDAWLDTQRIKRGAVWSTEIEREIDTRQVTVALLSPASSDRKSAVPNNFAPSTRVTASSLYSPLKAQTGRSTYTPVNIATLPTT